MEGYNWGTMGSSKKRPLEKTAQASVGRPTILDGDLLAALERHLEQGLSVKAACALCGLSRQSYYYWLRLGREYLDAGEHGNDKRVIYAYFAQRVQRAQALFELRVYNRSLNTKEYNPAWVRDLTLLRIRKPANWSTKKSHRQKETVNDPDDKYL